MDDPRQSGVPRSESYMARDELVLTHGAQRDPSGGGRQGEGLCFRLFYLKTDYIYVFKWDNVVFHAMQNRNK